MAQFNRKTAQDQMAQMIAQHQDVADAMTEGQVLNYLKVNYPWLEGLAKYYQLDAATLSKAACCWSFQWGLDYNANLGLPLDAPIPNSVWSNPDNYKQRCTAFCDALGAMHPFVGRGDSLAVRPEYLIKDQTAL
jgi:hypothetical protein